MTKNLVNLLCCPQCRSRLELETLNGNGKIETSAVSPFDDEVVTGILSCPCGMQYPIIDGVPRFLDGGLRAFPAFVKTWPEKIKGGIGLQAFAQDVPNGDQPRDYEYIRQSFSKEWGFFDFAADKTWGWTLEERKRVFLADLGLAETDLPGKRLLDAGCGNGTLTAALGTFGMEVVGIDLNDGLGLSNLNKGRYAGKWADHVNYVQSNLFNSPFRHCQFDLLYCSGVIHHTPSSKETFGRLVPLVKRGGRMYVWVYGKRSIPVRAFFAAGRQLKRFMSLESLLTTCRVIAPFYKLGTIVVNALRISKFRGRNCREITLDLFDAFAPQYNHWHTEGEVQGWFSEEGFANIAVSGRQKHGFGVYGDRL